MSRVQDDSKRHKVKQKENKTLLQCRQDQTLAEPYANLWQPVARLPDVATAA